MRTGAIFARGSCRALKWMALFGVVFALGAGSAFAQVAIGVKSVTVVEKGAGNTVEEGALLTVRVTLDKRVPRSSSDTPGTATVTLTEVVASGALGDLGNAEANDVTLPGDTGAGITVTIPEQAESGTLNIVTGRDLDAVDEKFRLSAVVTAVTGATEDDDGTNQDNTATATAKTFDGKIVDAQDQVYELKLKTVARDVKEGSTFEVTLRAVPDRPENEDVNVFLQMSDTTNFTLAADGNTPGNMRTLNEEADNMLHTVDITAKANDKNRTDDTLLIEAFTGQVGRSSETTELNITVLDIHKLPDADAIEAEARDNKKYADGMMVTSVAEGGMVYVWVEVTNTTRDAVSDDEKFTISLAAADQNQLLDFRVSPSSLETEARGGFTSSGDDTEMRGPFTLEALSDEDIGEEELMLYVNLTGQSTTYGAGESNGTFSITIEDTTKPMVWAKSDDEIEAAVYAAKGEGPMSPGDSFEIMTEDIFMMADGVTVAYSATSDGDAASASASAAKVKVTAEEAGMAHVTVTATASMSGAKALPQTMSNVARIVFPVTVELSALAVAVAADPTEIEEGGTSTITATANRAVTEDTMIALTVIGDATLDADSITIAADSMSGSVMLTATEDDDYMDETVTVVASGAGINGTMQIAIAVTDNDEAPVDEPTVSAKSQEAVDAVFQTAIVTAAGGPEWVEGGDAAMVDMSMLFNVIDDAAPSYSGMSSDDMTVSSSSSGMMLTLSPMGAGMATITVTATDAASGDIATAMADVTVAALPLSVMVSASAESVEEGGSIMVTATANQMVDANTEVMLMRDGASTASLDDYMLEPPLITIMAGETEGSLTLTATDDTDVEGEEKLTLTGMVGEMAAGSVMLAITDNDMDITYTLSGPEDMNIAEGGSAELTATASSAVPMDTEVMVMRDGSSTASDADFTAESIMIMAGETTGTTMVMAVEDNEPDSGSGSPEMLTLYGMVDGMQTNSVSFYLWDAAVPALPVIAQLLLAAFLALGGYRRYLRR